MTKVKHPTLPVSREVRESQVESWLAAGWLLDAPKPSPVSESVEDAPRPSRRRKAD